MARDNLARSVVIMRPSLLGTKKFSLIAWPRHDRPPRRKNVVATEGALNLVDQEYLVSCAKNILTQTKIEKNFVLGFLLGGDTKDSHLDANMLKETIRKIKGAIEKLGGEILVSTSRRTPAVIERIVKDEFLGFAPCRFLVIANEKNHPDAVGAILALSKIVVASSESISMVSEAASSGRYVVVFNTGLLNKRHRLFIEHLSKAGYIYTSDADNLGKVIEDIWKNKPAVKTLQDNQRIREAVETRL
ncbi:MAG: ELM1/GtrOC1 family putative glycosyltransferase [bacterium]